MTPRLQSEPQPNIYIYKKASSSEGSLGILIGVSIFFGGNYLVVIVNAVSEDVMKSRQLVNGLTDVTCH